MRLPSPTARWHEGDARLTNAALGVLGFVLLVLTHQFVAEISRFTLGFDKVSLLSSVVYLGAVLLVRTQPVNRATLPLVALFALAMYAIPFLADPDRMSSDIYRYVWDGVVQHHGISPYRYVPGDPALSWLREPNQDVYDNINRREYARTIYPPVAQMIYWLATWFAPTVAAMKLTMLAFVALAGWALMRILAALGRPRAEVLLFLWCPLLIWEIGTAGHVDAAVCGFVSLALLFRLRNRPGWTGLFLGMAVMTKFYPLLLLPALYQRRDWKMPAAVAAVVAVGYGLYARVGWLVFGFLGGYQKEEGMESGSRYFLLDYVHRFGALQGVPKSAFVVFAAMVLGAICVWAWRYATVDTVGTRSAAEDPTHRTVKLRDEWGTREIDARTAGVGGALPAPAFVRASAMLALALMLLFSPHYAWYLAWLVPFMALAPSLPLYGYTLAFFYGYTTALAAPGPTMFLLNERIYGAVALASLLHVVLKRWPVWAHLVSRERGFVARRDEAVPLETTGK